jgi:hypothetical protein
MSKARQLTASTIPLLRVAGETDAGAIRGMALLPFTSGGVTAREFPSTTSIFVEMNFPD